MSVDESRIGADQPPSTRAAMILVAHWRDGKLVEQTKDRKTWEPFNGRWQWTKYSYRLKP